MSRIRKNKWVAVILTMMLLLQSTSIPGFCILNGTMVLDAENIPDARPQTIPESLLSPEKINTTSNTSLAALTGYTGGMGDETLKGSILTASTVTGDVYAVTESVYNYAASGNGTGLRGEYFDSIDLTDLKAAKIDPVIDFNWGNNSPVPEITDGSFSVKWAGQVQPKFSENYTFYTETHGGVRLWVNHQLLVDKWSSSGTIHEQGMIILTAGIKYDIKMEYREESGVGRAGLQWSSASQNREVIPRSQLYPAVTPEAPENITAAVSDDSVTLSWDAVMFAAAYDVEADGEIIDNGPDTIFVHRSLFPGTQHSYRVRARNIGGESGWSAPVTVITLPVVPAGMDTTAAEEAITLTWNPAAGAAGYDVEADGVILDNGNRTSYTHSSLMPGSTHTYRIRAKNAGGISGWSGQTYFYLS